MGFPWSFWENAFGFRVGLNFSTQIAFKARVSIEKSILADLGVILTLSKVNINP